MSGGEKGKLAASFKDSDRFEGSKCTIVSDTDSDTATCSVFWPRACTLATYAVELAA